MDMPGLDFERRTGLKKDEISDFLARAQSIEQQISDIKSGKVSIEELTARENAETTRKAEEERKKEQRRIEMELRKEETRKRDKVEERAHWWEGANVLFGEDVDEDAGCDVEAENGETVREKRMRRYENDYARWGDSSYVPDDEATRAEAAEVTRAKEAKENNEFEANNSDFCKNFVDDMDKRDKSQKKKDETAAAKRLRGNRSFKAKKFDDALKLYREALRERPYERTTLLNLAQVFLKQHDWADAVEFASRALKISKVAPTEFRAKVLSRRAAAFEAQKDFGKAADDLRKARGDLADQQRSNSSASLAESLEAVSRQLAMVLRLQHDAKTEAAVVGKATEVLAVHKAESGDAKAKNAAEAEAMMAKLAAWSQKDHKGALGVDEMMQDLMGTADEGSALQAVEDFCSGALKCESNDDLARLATALQASGDARVLLRLKGGVEAMCALLGAKQRPDAGAVGPCADGAFDLDQCDDEAATSRGAARHLHKSREAGDRAILLSALAAACREEPKSKKAAIDAGALDACAVFLRRESEPACRAAAAEVIAELGSSEFQLDERFGVDLVSSDSSLLSGLVRLVVDAAANLDDVPLAAGAAHAAKALRDLSTREASRKRLLDLADDDVVEALARLAKNAAGRATTDAPASQMCAALADEAQDYATTALAHLAFEAAARPRFAVAMDGACDAASTPCGALLRVARDAPRAAVRAAALAALTNVCLKDEAGGRRACEACEAAGGVAVAFAATCKESGAADVRVRAAQLLARLVTTNGADGSAASTLRASPKALPRLAAIARLQENAALRDALVRCVAGTFHTDGATVQRAVVEKLHLEDDLFVGLALAVLPVPRTDLGDVTALSVCQPYALPKPPASTVANVAKLLVAPLSCPPDFSRPFAASLRAAGMLERLVSLMANYSEISVRRNAAVVLAKIIALDATAKDRVRDLRGMEMITTLGNSLL
ncbi:hypothetical protein M885DRAFT_617649 [Pelagophyceae sp. CCMP2097]|nr:hypothetical protein M885DRAFT_617649 [Pelagophyceae sp. CCMP2097]